MSTLSRMDASDAEALGSCMALEPILIFADNNGIDYRWASNVVGGPIEDAVRSNKRIPWDDFIEIIARLGEGLKSAGGWRALQDSFGASSIGNMARTMGLFLAPGLLYRLAWVWIGPQWFPHLISTFHQVNEQCFHFTLEIPAPHAFDRGYFEITRIMLRELPTQAGLPMAEVELKIDGRRAEFIAHTSPPRTLLGRFKRWLNDRFFARRIDDAIQRERSMLLDGFATLANEKRRLEASAQARGRAVETIRAAIFELSVDTGERTVSADYFRLFGTDETDERTVEQIWIDTTHPADRERVREAIDTLRSGSDEHVEIEFRIEVPDKTKYIRARATRQDQGRATIAAAFNDVTSTRAAFEVASRALNRLERVLEVAPFAVAVHAEQQTIFSNHAFDKLPTETKRFLLERQDIERDSAPELLLVPTELRDRDLHLRVQNSTIDWEGSPAILTTIDDVTITQAIVERSMVMDRMAATGTHAAGIAHEINNPLAYVHSNLEFAIELLSKESVAHQQDETFQGIQEALADAKAGTVRVRDVVAALKDFSRHANGELRPTDLPDVIHRAVNIVWSELRHRAELVTAFEVAQPVMADPVNLIQVLVAILRNSVAAMPTDRRGRIHIRATKSESGALIEVIDDGEGIAPDVLQRVFDPFFTTRPPGEGAGLGLALSRSRMERMGGRLRLRSSPTAGTVAEIRLPFDSEG